MPAIRARRRDAERPVAARAEEADLAGAVGDLRVVAVLRAQVDAARDEPEVAAAHEAQQAGQDQADDADPLDVVPDGCTSTTTRRRPRTRRTGTPRRRPKIRHSVFIVVLTARPVGSAPYVMVSRVAVAMCRTGCVVVAYGASPIDWQRLRRAHARPLGREELVWYSVGRDRRAARSSSASGTCRTARRSGRRTRPSCRS